MLALNLQPIAKTSVERRLIRPHDRDDWVGHTYVIKRFARRVRKFLVFPVLDVLVRDKGEMIPHPAQQLSLSMSYRQLYASGNLPLRFRDVGFRAYSQSEEDGIVLYIFSLIGVTNKKCVELCAGDGRECNTANLIVNHRWIGMLCDGNAENIRVAEQFYSKCPDTKYWPPRIVYAWLTSSNVNDLVAKHGFAGEIDLLSLDVDGIDYWLWTALTCARPRVVVLEFNHLWGSDVSVTVPDRDGFKAEFTQWGFDPYTSPAACFDHPRAQFGMSERLPKVKDKEWLQVTTVRLNERLNCKPRPRPARPCEGIMRL